jgi:hypothetical protein
MADAILGDNAALAARHASARRGDMARKMCFIIRWARYLCQAEASGLEDMQLNGHCIDNPTVDRRGALR